jgi:hypothetical protein
MKWLKFLVLIPNPRRSRKGSQRDQLQSPRSKRKKIRLKKLESGKYSLFVNFELNF